MANVLRSTAVFIADCWQIHCRRNRAALIEASLAQTRPRLLGTGPRTSFASNRSRPIHARSSELRDEMRRLGSDLGRDEEEAARHRGKGSLDRRRCGAGSSVIFREQLRTVAWSPTTRARSDATSAHSGPIFAHLRQIIARSSVNDAHSRPIIARSSASEAHSCPSIARARAIEASQPPIQRRSCAAEDRSAPGGRVERRAALR